VDLGGRGDGVDVTRNELESLTKRLTKLRLDEDPTADDVVDAECRNCFATMVGVPPEDDPSAICASCAQEIVHQDVPALLNAIASLTEIVADHEGVRRAAILLLQTAYREWDEDKDHRVGNRISEARVAELKDTVDLERALSVWVGRWPSVDDSAAAWAIIHNIEARRGVGWKGAR
jgi:hypothetical protein